MKLPVDSPNIFKKSNIDRYIDRPNGGKYNAVFSIFTYVEFTTYYTVNKNLIFNLNITQMNFRKN